MTESYYRAQRDTLLDKRLTKIEDDVAELSDKIDRLEGRINYLFGGLALLIAVANLAIPLLIHWITDTQ